MTRAILEARVCQMIEKEQIQTGDVGLVEYYRKSHILILESFTCILSHTKSSVTTIYFAQTIFGFKVSQEEIAKKYKAFFEEIWKQK